MDILKTKDFYLKIKVANIRKVLTENASLNQELCLDSKTHADTFNMKLFVRALEDIAEEEQEKLVAEDGKLPSAEIRSEVQTPRSDTVEENKESPRSD